MAYVNLFWGLVLRVFLFECVGFFGGKEFLSKALISVFKTVKTLRLVNMKTMLNIKVTSGEVLGLTPKPDFQIYPFVLLSRGTA